MKKTTLVLVLSSVIFLFVALEGVNAQKTRHKALRAITAPDIDGNSNDECWTKGEWNYINHQWFNNRQMPDSTDFYGRFKVVWTPEKIFILLEITDDVLNDDIADPLDRYWEDDCIEVFIDEDKSGGDHRCCATAYNAFAYHISPVTYDAVDLSADGDFVPKLYNDHIDIAVHSVGDFHTVEIAILIFDDTYKDNEENTPVTLTENKLMGFSIAYCDDDGNGREDFIGTQAGGLDSWMNADLFGELLLMDEIVSTPTLNKSRIEVMPNTAHSILYASSDFPHGIQYQIIGCNGATYQQGYFNESRSLPIENLSHGIYFLRYIHNQEQHAHKFIW